MNTLVCLCCSFVELPLAFRFLSGITSPWRAMLAKATLIFIPTINTTVGYGLFSKQCLNFKVKMSLGEFSSQFFISDGVSDSLYYANLFLFF